MIAKNGILYISLAFNLSKPTNIFAKPNDNTVNIPDIRIAVMACPNPIVFTVPKTHDETAMAVDIDNITIGRYTIVLLIDSIFISFRAFNIFPKPNDSTVNIPAIRIAVTACPNPIGVTNLNIHDDIAMDNDIDVIASII